MWLALRDLVAWRRSRIADWLDSLVAPIQSWTDSDPFSAD